MLLATPASPRPSRYSLSMLRDSLRAWVGPANRELSAADRRNRDFAMLTPRFADYAIGVVSLLMGDRAATLRSADVLTSQSGDTDERALATGLAAGLRAMEMAARGDSAGALRLLESSSPSIKLYDTGELSAFPRERFLRAHLLKTQHRYQEAAAWFESIGQAHFGDVTYVRAATAALVDLAAQRGDSSTASTFRTRLRELGRE